MPYIDEIKDPEIVEDNLAFAIENRFIEYFAQHNIDITDYEVASKIHQQRFYSAFRYVFKCLFEIPENVKLKHYKKTSIDYNDYETLEKIANIYIDLCEAYHIEPSYYGYCRLTGLNYGVFCRWAKGDVSGLSNPEKLISISQMIQGASQNFTRSQLETSAIGQITKANHDEEKGLLYARKSAVAALGAVKIDSLMELTGRYIEHHNVTPDQ